MQIVHVGAQLVPGGWKSGSKRRNLWRLTPESLAACETAAVFLAGVAPL